MLPIAAINLLSDLCNIFQQFFAFSRENIDLDLSANREYFIEEALNNETREHTICFKMPDNKHHYIALTVYAFSDYICQWIGSVNDCYILHSGSPNRPFQNFRVATPFLFFSESEKKENITFRVNMDEQTNIG